MISGAHVIVYTKDTEADRAFFRDVLGFPSVDAGHGWLIFALPPGEAAFHPSEKNGPHELYFLCDNLKSEMAGLSKKGVACSEVSRRKVGLYYAYSAARRWRNRSLPTKASHRAGVNCETEELTDEAP
jgi:catechol 2,3-dioxygenase-like lactoylglutathione lyase family enzyme